MTRRPRQPPRQVEYTAEYDAPIGNNKTVKNWYGRWPTHGDAVLWIAKQSKPQNFKIVPWQGDVDGTVANFEEKA